MLIPAPRSLHHHTGARGALLISALRHEIDPDLGAEEYRLTTAVADGDVDAQAPRAVVRGPLGLARARTSLAQLALQAVDGRYPPVSIQDGPRFAHRGLSLDIARHFQPVGTVLAVIDLLAELKLNVLHLHLTDDQGWRLEIPELPELTRAGAAGGMGESRGGYLSLADYRRIQDHAAANNVTVIPEIDVPGHVNAALVAYPHLAPPGVEPEPYHGHEVGFSRLDVYAEGTYTFLETVLGRVARVTDGPYLHVGGDECHAMPDADYAFFAERLVDIVAATGKTLIGWHELGQSKALRPGTIGQYWNLTTPWTPQQDRFGIDHAARTASFVRQGGSLILSPADVTYFDHRHAAQDTLGVDWIGGPITLAQAYEWDPSQVLPELSEAVIGLEATIWTEFLPTREDIFTLLLPRLAAFAEIAWSPAPSEGQTRSLADLTPRLDWLAQDWRRRDIPFHAGALHPATPDES